MKILLVLVAVFSLSALGLKLVNKKSDLRLALRLALSVLLLYSALGAFVSSAWLQTLLPQSFELDESRSVVAGAVELVLAIGLQIPRYQKIFAWILIGYLLFILPPVLSSSINTIYHNPQNFDSVNTEYLWFRIPIQFALIISVYLSAIRSFPLRNVSE